MPSQPPLIGLTGTNGAGKGEAAKYLESLGYAYYSLSDILREELAARGEPATRDNLIRVGNELRARFGPDILALRTLKKLRPGGRAVIDSIRNAREVAALRRQPGFVLVAIDAPAEVRFARVQARGRDESAATLGEFLAKEDEERRGGEAAQQLEACLALADIRIENTGTLQDLHRRLEEAL
jgi:dCMP deaminase